MKYKSVERCPRCNSENKFTVADMCGYQLTEAKTKCTECGHEDYWANGNYGSESEKRRNK